MPRPDDRLRGFSPKVSADIETILSQIAQLGQSGRLAEAEQRCQQLLQRYPKVARGWDMLGLIALQQGQTQTALQHIKKAIRLDPNQSDFHDHAGVAHCNGGDLAAGILCYQEALRLNPHTAHVQYNLGLAQSKLGHRDAARQTFGQLIAQQPSHAPAHYQMGNLYQQQRDLTTAIAHYQQAVQHYPQYAEAWYNLGVSFQEASEYPQAEAAYRQALSLRPDYPEALNGMGTLLERQGQGTAAIDHYQRALSLQPPSLHTLLNLGNLYVRLERLPEAKAIYYQALTLDEQNLQALDSFIKIKLKQCDWENLAELIDRFTTLIFSNLSPNLSHPPSPFNSLFLPFTAAEQQSIAQAHAQAIVQRIQHYSTSLPTSGPLYGQLANRSSSPLRLGYVSGDFRNHAVGHLILQLFELHDRQQFQVYAYSLGPDDGSDERQKLMADCDCFREVSALTPRQIAQQIQQDQIDILIDLAGYTDYSCPELFALRPAPIQINYLGYPGTLGADSIDYIITDRVIAPPEIADHLTEQCLYLPDSYQLNSYAAIDLFGSIPIEPLVTNSAFTFCCFNKSEKIEPQLFAVWMQILAQVPGSTLWLLSDRPETEQNLKIEVERHGIAPARLQFVPRVLKAEHLARQQAFDLFLDTLFYNAHVTASDALWSGVPVITLLGETFASRVAASLLTAVGLPELITHSLQEYEQLAVHLATHPTELKQLKDKLASARHSFPLFNTSRTVRHLEAGYRQVWERHQSGLAPGVIWVEGEGDRKSKIEEQKSGTRDSCPSRERWVSSLNPTYENVQLSPTGYAHAPRTVLHPQSTVPQKQATVLSPQASSITCSIDHGFQTWLSQVKGSVLMTTYQAGKVILVGWNGDQVTVLPRQFPKPMGVAMAADRLALVTQQEVLVFANAPALVNAYLPDQPGRYDALYLPRAAYFTGDLLIHDLAFGADGLWAVNTRFSCLATLSPEYSFIPRWQPVFISELAPEDRCHLNGMAIVAGQPKYVTALGRTNTPRGWSPGKGDGGILIDVESQEILLQGLSMPHSPRWYRDQLWLLNSGTGELWQVDPRTGQHQVVCTLPGFGRGLAFVDDYALVGLSQIREQHIFGGLPIQTQFDRLLSGIAVVNLTTGNLTGLLEFPTGCQELYEVVFLPDILQPMLLSPSDEAAEAITTPDFDYWMRQVLQ